MSLGTAFLKVQKVIVKNAPTILAVMGAVGAVASVGLAIDGTLKAQEELDKLARDQKGESYYKAQEAQYLLEAGQSNTDICEALEVKTDNEDEAKQYVEELVSIKPFTTKEKFWFYAKHYIPSAVMLGASIFCIFSGNHISKKRILQLTGALAASTVSLNEYKDKVAEVVGKKKAEEINDEVIQEKILKNPPTKANTIIPQMSNIPDLSLWYDVASDRYFFSSIDYIRKAEVEAQRMLEKNGSLSRNDVYAILGIREIDLAETRSWIYDSEDSGVHHQVILKTGAMLDDKGNPVGTLEMNDLALPSNEWFSEI